MNALHALPTILAQSDYSGGGDTGSTIGAIIGFLVWLVIIVVMLASLWKIMVKAGRQGWEGIIPIYNYWVLAEISGKPGWWGLMCLIPCVGIVFAIMIVVAVAQAFGKSVGFAIGMILLPIIFFPILAFGDATYQGPARQLPPA